MTRANLIAAARGDRPVDLLLRRARVLDLFRREVVDTDVGILGDRIVGLGERPARREIDLEGAFLGPGFIDAHVHVESSMVPPAEFGRAVMPRGTTTVVTDPHEIANVCGEPGIRFMLEDARRSALSMFVMASSCVPATAMETAGASLEAADLIALADDPQVLGLAEVMNFPGVVAADPGVLAKIDGFSGRPVDGHCPGLSGRALEAYAAAGIGSDHECTSLAEAEEKIRAGLVVFIREATNARNLETLLPLVRSPTADRVCFCTDDRTPGHLLGEGHVDSMVRRAVAGGVDPWLAIRAATWNPASHFGLRDRGAVAPGLRADLVAFTDLRSPDPHLVIVGGRVVARDGCMIEPRSGAVVPDWLRHTVQVAWDQVDLRIPAHPSFRVARVIGAIPDQLVTRHETARIGAEGGYAVTDPGRDLLAMAVVERHGRGGRVGTGFVRGLGLRRGALASTVAHDHHNLVLVGVDPGSMRTAGRRASELGGGLVVADGGEVLAEVPLPVAGLMSEASIEEVRDRLAVAIESARHLGARLADPFMALSFLALEVIPSLKLTDHGPVDVDRFEVVPLWVDEG